MILFQILKYPFFEHHLNPSSDYGNVDITIV